EAVRRAIDDLLHAHGARIDATYMCPHHPDFDGGCDCRKPGLMMYERAIDVHGLDPARSLFAGDRWRDVAPAATLGGLPIMLDVESTPAADLERARAESIAVATSLADAVDQFLRTLPA
ncbi:MAG TPA: HAD hydrolase-like protein, partial [Candidatus Limnocylindrales bacterium]|nr:HAD hydrolase-like protein [Candidatus Limnocylindrales bacterium]